MKKQRTKHYNHAEEANKLENLEKRYEECKIGKKKELTKFIVWTVVFVIAVLLIINFVNMVIFWVIPIDTKDNASVSRGIVEKVEMKYESYIGARLWHHKYFCYITLDNGFKAYTEFKYGGNRTKCEKELEDIREKYLGKDAEIWYFPPSLIIHGRKHEIVEINGERTRWDWYKMNSIGFRIVLPIF